MPRERLLDGMCMMFAHILVELRFAVDFAVAVVVIVA